MDKNGRNKTLYSDTDPKRKFVSFTVTPFNGRNKTLYKYHFNYSLSKLIVGNGLKDLWRRENPEFSEFTYYNRPFGTGSTIDRVYTNIKMATNSRINHIMVSFTDHYNAIFIDRFPSKTKIGIDS